MYRIPHVTHGYGPMVPGTDYFAAAIGSAISDADLPDPIPAVFAAPYLDDQPSNTAAVLPTGAALALQPDETTADAVAEALGRLLNEPSFRQAANRLRAEIDRMPTAAAALDEILASTDG